MFTPLFHHDEGLQFDLNTLAAQENSRRKALKWMAAGLAALPLAACGGSTTEPVSCNTVIPSETAGPYPGDGTNSNTVGVANTLTQSGIVRSDIRASFGSAGTNMATGIPLMMVLELVNANDNCTPLSGYAIYLWHCDVLGRYSMYSSGVTAENYLRGVQATGSDGKVTFTTIFPGCYDGRMPHMHFEVFSSLTQATSGNNDIKTSQLTFPLSTLNEAYETTAYATSKTNLAKISFATDNIFSDGTASQICTVTGSPTAGYTATLKVSVAV